MKHQVTRPEDGRTQPFSRSRDIFAGLQESLTGKRQGRSAAGLRIAGDTLPETWPTLEVSEDDKEIMVRLEVPGLAEKDLELNYADGTLIVKGEKKEEREDRKRDVYYRESRYGSFVRSIPIGAGVDFSKAKAVYRNGVLKVELPKTAAAQRKQIPIT
ncbi:MAG TPA: Hsp20/alpha crystallin family protein [Fibrobacteria bacterium]|nr:Hsp20/alpha crystallin family protein [Fibrobacteria bacterium]